MKKSREMRPTCSDIKESGQDCPASLGTSIGPVYAGKHDDLFASLQLLIQLDEMLDYVTQHSKATQPLWIWQLRQGFSFTLHKKSNGFPELKKYWRTLLLHIHHTSLWYSTSLCSKPIFCKNSWNWWWFRPHVQMKFPVFCDCGHYVIHP